jgi:hypothetical protein
MVSLGVARRNRVRRPCGWRDVIGRSYVPGHPRSPHVLGRAWVAVRGAYNRLVEHVKLESSRVVAADLPRKITVPAAPFMPSGSFPRQPRHAPSRWRPDRTDSDNTGILWNMCSNARRRGART